MPVTDKQYKLMESCYLSASDKLLRLQVEHERLQIKNKMLVEACEEALNNLDRLNDSGFGPVTDMASNKTYQMLFRVCTNDLP